MRAVRLLVALCVIAGIGAQGASGHDGVPRGATGRGLFGVDRVAAVRAAAPAAGCLSAPALSDWAGCTIGTLLGNSTARAAAADRHAASGPGQVITASPVSGDAHAGSGTVSASPPGPPPHSVSVQKTGVSPLEVSDPEGDELSLTYLAIGDVSGDTIECPEFGNVPVNPGAVIGACVIETFVDSVTGDTAPANNTLQAWWYDACGNLLRSTTTSGWHTVGYTYLDLIDPDEPMVGVTPPAEHCTGICSSTSAVDDEALSE